MENDCSFIYSLRSASHIRQDERSFFIPQAFPAPVSDRAGRVVVAVVKASTEK
jgi:hypothetical protein